MDLDGIFPRRLVMDNLDLTPEQEESAARIEDVMRAAFTVEVRRMARMLASKKNRELLGETEFQMRDAVHRVAAQGIDAALEERKKGGTEVPVCAARSAGKTASSKATDEPASRP
jgi:hypothetical protein